MKKINTKFAYDENGKKTGVILGIDDFEACVDILEDYQDYLLVKQRSSKKEKLITHEKVVEKTLKRIKI